MRYLILAILALIFVGQGSHAYITQDPSASCALLVATNPRQSSDQAERLAMKLLASGNREEAETALAWLKDRYTPTIYQVVGSKFAIYDMGAREEIRDEVFIKLWELRNQYDPERSPPTLWVARWAFWLGGRYRSKERRSHRTFSSLTSRTAEEETTVDFEDPRPRALTEAEEKQSFLFWLYLRVLPQNTEDYQVIKATCESPGTPLSTILHIPPSHVGSTVYRVRQRMRSFVEAVDERMPFIFYRETFPADSREFSLITNFLLTPLPDEWKFKKSLSIEEQDRFAALSKEAQEFISYPVQKKVGMMARQGVDVATIGRYLSLAPVLVRELIKGREIESYLSERKDSEEEHRAPVVITRSDLLASFYDYDAHNLRLVEELYYYRRSLATVASEMGIKEESLKSRMVFFNERLRVLWGGNGLVGLRNLTVLPNDTFLRAHQIGWRVDSTQMPEGWMPDGKYYLRRATMERLLKAAGLNEESVFAQAILKGKSNAEIAEDRGETVRRTAAIFSAQFREWALGLPQKPGTELPKFDQIEMLDAVAEIRWRVHRRSLDFQKSRGSLSTMAHLPTKVLITREELLPLIERVVSEDADLKLREDRRIMLTRYLTERVTYRELALALGRGEGTSRTVYKVTFNGVKRLGQLLWIEDLEPIDVHVFQDYPVPEQKYLPVETFRKMLTADLVPSDRTALSLHYEHRLSGSEIGDLFGYSRGDSGNRSLRRGLAAMSEAKDSSGEKAFFLVAVPEDLESRTPIDPGYWLLDVP